MARRRPHPAAATRILLAGLTTAAMLGIVSALALAEPPMASTTPTVVAAPSTPSPTLVRKVYRSVPIGASGASSSVGTPNPISSGSSTPAPTPTPTPAPQPITQTRGS